MLEHLGETAEVEEGPPAWFWRESTKPLVGRLRLCRRPPAGRMIYLLVRDLAASVGVKQRELGRMQLMLDNE